MVSKYLTILKNRQLRTTLSETKNRNGLSKYLSEDHFYLGMPIMVHPTYVYLTSVLLPSNHFFHTLLINYLSERQLY